MSFIEEINQLLNIDGSASDICVTFMPSKGAVLQGYKKLLEIDDEKILIIGKNKRKILVSGINLEISSLAPSELVIKGKVVSVGEYNE